MPRRRQRGKTTQQQPLPRFRAPALGIFVTAAVFRLWHVLQMRTAPFFDMKMGDARSYDRWAQAIAAGDWLGSEVFYQAPLYPYFLGTVYATLGDGALVVRLVQALFGAAACVLIALASKNLFGRATGVAAGLLLALYGPAIFFDGLIQKSVLDLFFLALLLWLLTLAVDSRRPSLWVGLGAAMGGLILTRENALLLVLPVVVWLGVEHRAAMRRALLPAGLFFAGLSLVLLPVATRNRVVGGEFHLTTSQLGPNLYIGNHAGAKGLYQPLRPDRQGPEFERTDATQMAEDASGRSLTPAEVSRYWTGRAVDYARSQPVDWMRLMLRKFTLTWNATEQVDTEDMATHADASLPLRVTGTLLHFGVLVPLACVGLWLTRDRRSKLWLFYLLPGIYAASVVVFYVFARYRYPLVPMLVPFAAAGLVRLPAFWRESPWTRRLALTAAVGLIGVFCNRPMGSVELMQAATYSNVGRALELQGKLDQAIEQYRESLRIKPDYAEAANSLGTVLQKQGKLDQAIEHYRQAIELDPALSKAESNLGTALLFKGRLGEAIRHHRRAVEIAPGRADAHANLGTALQKSGDIDGALLHYREAIALDRRHVAAHRNAGIALAQDGRLQEALEYFVGAIELAPDDHSLRLFAGQALLRLGRVDEAIEQFSAGLRRQPEHEGLRRALERARSEKAEAAGDS